MAIPISLVAAGLVLYWSGADVNTMILAGLVVAVGVVVDDAIIDVENILRRLRQNRARGRAAVDRRVILEASLEVRGAIIYATVITLVAVVPVFFIGGLSGSFFRPLVGAYALAVGVSLVVALTVTPALALILLRNGAVERRIATGEPCLQRGYTPRAVPDRPQPQARLRHGRRHRRAGRSRSSRCSGSRCCRRSRSATS